VDVRLFARERENVGQQGFNGLVYGVSPAMPPVKLGDGGGDAGLVAGE
jgi:hypothetical protein